jgi:hypothetical protein
VDRGSQRASTQRSRHLTPDAVTRRHDEGARSVRPGPLGRASRTITAALVGLVVLAGCAADGDPPTSGAGGRSSTSTLLPSATTDGALGETTPATDPGVDDPASDAADAPPIDAPPTFPVDVELVATALRSLAAIFPDAVAVLSADPATAAAVEAACRAAVGAVAEGLATSEAADAVIAAIPADGRDVDVQSVLVLAAARYFILGGCGDDADALVPALNQLASDRL